MKKCFPFLNETYVCNFYNAMNNTFVISTQRCSEFVSRFLKPIFACILPSCSVRWQTVEIIGPVIKCIVSPLQVFTPEGTIGLPSVRHFFSQSVSQSVCPLIWIL